MFKKSIMALALGVSAVAIAPSASAQVQLPAGLVTVTIGNVIVEDVLSGFLNDVELNLLNNSLNGNDVSVQVPIGVAANVCNIGANILAHGETGGTCAAESGSQALAQAVRKQYLR